MDHWFAKGFVAGFAAVVGCSLLLDILGASPFVSVMGSFLVAGVIVNWFYEAGRRSGGSPRPSR